MHRMSCLLPKLTYFSFFDHYFLTSNEHCTRLERWAHRECWDEFPCSLLYTVIKLNCHEYFIIIFWLCWEALAFQSAIFNVSYKLIICNTILLLKCNCFVSSLNTFIRAFILFVLQFGLQFVLFQSLLV